MQVFVPYADIQQSIECLDPSRLGNQIYRECLTLARRKWPNHPVTKMWEFHTYFLCEYAFAGLYELERRSGKFYGDIFDKFHDIQMRCLDTGPPSWWGDAKVHNSHKANLYRKDPSYYADFRNYKQVPYYYPTLDIEAELRNIKRIKDEKDRANSKAAGKCLQSQ